MPHGSSSPRSSPPWRAVGFWLALAIGLYLVVNVIRVVADPAGFAVYFGLPLAAPEDVGLVYVYALRTLFIALIIAAFLIRGDLRALQWVALAGVILPLGDAWLAHSAGAPVATIARHGAIALFLLVAVYFLRRGAQQRAEAA
ncbi:MAG: DUF4267 domain-containing protein [Alphaproteobacteria bacterium]|nr:DUF4267 domain-containing protein [Alphaproteobacteria bacterium]